MPWLSATNLDALATINAQHTDRHIKPVIGDRGGWVVGADLLADCGGGCYWQGYREWLENLTPTDEVPATETLD